MSTSHKNQKNPDNPFSRLDASLFPKKRQRGQSGGKPAVQHSRGLEKNHKSKGVAPGATGVVEALPGESVNSPEERLFLRAMASISPLGKGARRAEKSRPTEQGEPPKNDRPSALVRDAASPPVGSAPPVACCTEQKKTAVVSASGPEDADALDFFKAVSGVRPLAGKGREVPLEPEPPIAPPMPQVNPLQDIVEGRVEFALNSTDEYVEGHIIGLDLLTIGKLQARHYSPESHIDLHGLNSQQAFQTLVHFFRKAYHNGVRTALIVTGRGKNSPHGIPVLRQKVQEWLVQDPFRRVVLAFCTAKREDGGPGALYVLLRKYRKNSGKIRWDATPADPDLF